MIGDSQEGGGPWTGPLNTALASLLVLDDVPREPQLGRHLLPMANPAPHSPGVVWPSCLLACRPAGPTPVAKVQGGRAYPGPRAQSLSRARALLPGPSNTRSETPGQRPTDLPYTGAQMGRGWASVLNT